MDTFTPPIVPNISSNVTFQTAVLEAKFGDGYEQVVSAGLNSVTGKYTLQFDLLTQAQRIELEAFFIAKKGAEAFYYTFPGETSARKFRCQTWSRGHTGSLFSVSAEFKEVFDLV